MREISLKRYEGNFHKVDFINSKLIISDFIVGGEAKFNWLILDTLGNLIINKGNSIPPFEENIGVGGGTYKFDNKLYYWNFFNDTVFSILPDLSYNT